MEDKTCYTIDQVAALLQLSRKTVTRYIQRGDLKATKLERRWLIRAEDLEEFTAQGIRKKQPAITKQQAAEGLLTVWNYLTDNNAHSVSDDISLAWCSLCAAVDQASGGQAGTEV